MTHPDRQLFDFNSPVHGAEQPFDEFVREAETQAQGSRFHRSSQQTLKTLLMAVITLNVVGIGVFGFLYLDRYTGTPEAQVAGVQDSTVPAPASPIQTLGGESAQPNVVSGSGYSVVSTAPIPEGYKQSSDTEDMPGLTNRQASLSRYLIDDSQTGTRIRTGFEVLRAEYDGKLTRDEFAQAVLEDLGPETHRITNPGFVLPKDIRATIIEATDEQQIYYYVATTANNYYVIKIYNQTVGNRQFQAYTDFVSNLDSTLYLN